MNNEIYIFEKNNAYKEYAKIDTEYVRYWADVVDDWNPKYVMTHWNYDNIIFVIFFYQLFIKIFIN